MIILLSILLFAAASWAAYLFAENALLRTTAAKAEAQAADLLDRLLVKHGQTPLSEPVSTPKVGEQPPPLTLYQQRILEGAREDDEEAKRFRTIPLSDEEKEELAEEARRRR